MPNQTIYILSIESSCDDTSIAVLKNQTVLSNVVASQKVHQNYGGVVPELASRAHQQNIIPVMHQALKEAKIEKTHISAIAFTRGPGLMGSLLVGTSFAKSLAMALEIPLIEVNHMQAHLLAHFIDDAGQEIPSFPFLGITISGGHTQIVKVTHHFELEVIGETLDDAIGEAFDKGGKMLGLSYPAGPQIDKLAKLGNPKSFDFPIPNVKELNFSFSGLKTALLYFIQKSQKENPNFIEENLADICASYQYTIVKILTNKIKKAVKQTGIREIAIGGGVSANREIRETLQQLALKHHWKVHIPKFEYTTDNAAMIGIVGYYKYLEKDFCGLDVTPKARFGF
ncbi:tRNA (adenosine(37)-N6)-threonylcarbamoyltransferase complex transferase subunit TsaD [Mesonia sp. K7]|uniref:tRNA (adenosine(37)-N6)-threonylcarbamoyltransferase complex transferase subunit TsaD n=1 Tax=Mesonia sp. K7 TaxID=2218606 RepID=UPI000DAA1386|nr:tRNA (adenosine(37)-N6)-threonylcarbamoyltransferase complex transferase subunit TsaD [Mesonia sp. K7]PZD76843.1 tRNA (adenosine(37)-N6)-threonylcarbamoyltransferase complex transferase subunit TsaD [Mesonia sp. K7]